MSDQNLFGLKAKAPKRSKTPASADVHRLIGVWVNLFERKFHERPVVTPADGAALKRLVSERGARLVEARLTAYFRLEDRFLSAEGYPLRMLPKAWNRLVVAEADERPKVPGVEETERYQRQLKAK